MKSLALLAIMTVAFNASASAPTEGSVFSILEKNGVFVQDRSTKVDRTRTLELRSISCMRYDRSADTSCYFVDAARPMEKGTLGGNDAVEMYDAIVLSGAKTGHVFGETIAGLSVLQCEKNISNNGITKFQCRTLKPMLASSTR